MHRGTLHNWFPGCHLNSMQGGSMMKRQTLWSTEPQFLLFLRKSSVFCFLPLQDSFSICICLLNLSLLRIPSYDSSHNLFSSLRKKDCVTSQKKVSAGGYLKLYLSVLVLVGGSTELASMLSKGLGLNPQPQSLGEPARSPLPGASIYIVRLIQPCLVSFYF